MIKKCEIKDCTINTFENEMKCILHCDKTISNDWIKSTKHESNSEIDTIMLWTEHKVNEFWETLFKEVKVKILASVKQNGNTTNEAVRVLAQKTKNDNKNKFLLSFLNVKFPPNIKLLESHISSNNKIILHNDFQDCCFYDNCLINICDSKAEFKKKTLNIKQISENTENRFYGCDFQQNLIMLRPYNSDEIVTLSDCTIKHILKLESSFDTINIENTSATGFFLTSSDKSNINNLKIVDCPNLKNIKIENYSILNLDIKKIETSSIQLKNIDLTKSSIKEINANTFSFFNIDILENAKVLFENIKTKIFNLERLSQDATYIRFDNISVSNKFKCNRAEFKNSYFNNFNIEIAVKEIYKTSFIGAHLNSIQWGKIFKIKSTKDIFRQLKYVNDAQGNHIDANNFYITEMQTHKIRTLDKKPWFSNYWQEKLTFLLAKKISNFGQNWFLAFLWIVIVNLISYTYTILDINLCTTLILSIILLLFWSIGRSLYKFSIGKKVSFYVTQHISVIFAIIFTLYYLQLGSIHNIMEFISLKTPKQDTVLYKDYLHIWFLNKALSSFLIYYFVVALRRQTQR